MNIEDSALLGWMVPSASISPNPPAISKIAPKPNRRLCQLLSPLVSVLLFIFGCLLTSVGFERRWAGEGFIPKSKISDTGSGATSFVESGHGRRPTVQKALFLPPAKPGVAR